MTAKKKKPVEAVGSRTPEQIARRYSGGLPVAGDIQVNRVELWALAKDYLLVTQELVAARPDARTAALVRAAQLAADFCEEVAEVSDFRGAPIAANALRAALQPFEDAAKGRGSEVTGSSERRRGLIKAGIAALEERLAAEEEADSVAVPPIVLGLFRDIAAAYERETGCKWVPGAPEVKAWVEANFAKQKDAAPKGGGSGA